VSTLVVCLALVCARGGAGQDVQNSQWITRVGFTPAFVLPAGPFLSDTADGDRRARTIPSVTIDIGRQTDGSREWHHLYGLPTYGFGVSVASFGSGRPLDAYTFFSWPFARLRERIQLTTDFGMGVSWNWKEFDRATNSHRTVLGSNLNARVDWGFYLRHLTTEQMSVYAGVDFTHRSNGGMRQPNGGINVVGPSVALRYDLAPQRSLPPIKQSEPFRPSWELVVGGAAGRKNVVYKAGPDVSRHHGAFEATAAMQRHFYRFGKIGAGTDLAYDGASGARVAMVEGLPVQWRPAAGQRLALGMFGGYEHVINRFSALVHTGYTVWRGFDSSRPRFYVRYGWRYHVNDRLWALFSVRSIDGTKADFLEFGGGYRMRWQ
jgi:hypothetical protein